MVEQLQQSRLDYEPGVFTKMPTVDDRIALLVACHESEKARERAYRTAASNAKWFINAFAYTFDPRTDAVVVNDLPFILHKFQEDFIDWLELRVQLPADGVVEKSRDMGITWTYLAWVLHGWLFKPGFHVLLGSRKEEMVDNFTEKSLFGRLEYMIKRLPGWLLPPGFQLRKHRRERRLVNPYNGNEIDGEATNLDFGRQGRYTAVFFDEAAMWRDLELSWGSASGSTNARIAVSTPNRHHPQNFFYDIRKQVDTHTIPWDLHPNRDGDWARMMQNRLTEEEWEHEYNLSYQITATGKVYPSWNEVEKGHYPYQPGWELYTSWDFGIRDTSIIWWQRNSETGRLRMIDSYQNHDKPIDFYVPFIKGSVPSEWPHKYEPEEMRMITEHGQWGQPVNYGDPAGRQRAATDGRSVIDVLNEFGVYVHTNSSANDIDTRKQMTALGLRRLEVDIDRCRKVDAAMTNARYPEIRNENSRTSEVRKPLHDWTSHFRTAVEFFFVNEPIMFNYERPPVRRRPRAYQSLV